MKDEVQFADARQFICEKVPNYVGYAKKEDVTLSDREIRHYLLRQTDGIKNSFAQLWELHSDEDNFPHEIAKNINLSFAALKDTLRNPCYCSNGKITSANIAGEQTEKIVEYDQQLIEHIDILKEEINHLQDDIQSDQIGDQLNIIYDLIDGFNQLLSEREFLFLPQEE